MKKFFSAFLLMAAMAFSVSTFVACNDVVDDIEDVKAQTTQNAAAIESINAKIAELEADIAAAQKAADDAMAAGKAAQAAAEQAEANAIAYATEKLEALKAVYEAKVAEIESTLGDHEAALAQLEADVKAALDVITNELKGDIAKLIDADKAINTRLDALELYQKNAEALHIEITENIDSVATELLAAQSEIEEIWAAMYDENHGLFALIGSNSSAIQANTELIEALQTELNGLYEEIYGEGPNSIMSILSTYATMLEDLNQRFNTLDLRVQSLVYVPEYSDHKATLGYAVVSAGRLAGSFAYPTIVSQVSELKYLVKAEDAVAVAKSIAAKPEVLDYVVKGVQTRAEEADLEIVGVEAEGEYIIVSVVAKNFVNEFYTDTEEGMYSAALVFDDENNTRTTEFTNLVPAAEFEEFEMALFLPVEDADVPAEAIRMATKNEVVTYKMVCNDSETVKTAVKPIVGFLPVVDGQVVTTDPISFYTISDFFTEAGYVADVDMAITLVDTENNYNHDGTMDTKPGPISIDEYFNIAGGDPVYDFHYSVKPGVGFDNVGKKSTVTYTFTCGTAVATFGYVFELSNAQVAVNMEVNDAWTVAKEFGLAADYEILNIPYTTVGGNVENLNSLMLASGYEPEWYVMKDGAWTAADKSIFWLTQADVKGKAGVMLSAGNYSWNNSYKLVYRSTNENLHTDYTLTVVVNLVGRPEVINIPEVEVEFTLDGGMPYFFASADTLYKVAFKEMQKYFGYEDAKSADDYWTSEWVSFANQELFISSQKVNGVATPGIGIFTKEKVQAFLDIEKANEGEFPINVDEPNVITFTANTFYGIPVNFTITGNVVIPEATLIYSEDFVKYDENELPYVVAEGEIANDKYSIIKSDLAKYFNVATENVQDNNYTVVFETDNNYVSLERPEAEVMDKGQSTYHYLTEGSYLDWAEYTGLTVGVTATLYVNGYELDSRELRIETIDPLTLLAPSFEVERLYREDTNVNVFGNLVLTSAEEPAKANILAISDDATLESAIAYAKKVYGVELTVDLSAPGVYYYDSNDQPISVASNKYSYDNTTGKLVIFGDDSVVEKYYADFTVKMKSRICGGEHTESFQITLARK